METPIKLTTDFSAEIFGLEWNDIFKVVKGKKKTLLPNFTRVSKLSFRNEVGIKVSQDKQKLREFITTSLTKHTKGVPQLEAEIR